MLSATTYTEQDLKQMPPKLAEEKRKEAERLKKAMEKHVSPVWQKLGMHEKKSMFVPMGVHVQVRDGYLDKNFLGPFKGLAAYSSEYKLSKFSEVLVYPDKEDKDASEYVRICTTGGWCDTISKDTTTFERLNGIDISEKIGTVSVPENINVNLIAKDNHVVRITGPFTARKLDSCGKDWVTFEQIILKKETEKKETEKSASDVVIDTPRPAYRAPPVPDGKNEKVVTLFETRTEILTEEEFNSRQRADMMVITCKENYLKGLCLQEGSDFRKERGFFNKPQMFQKTCNAQVKSMKIPSGVKIDGTETTNKLKTCSGYGPYYGPVVIDRLGQDRTYDVKVTNLFKEANTQQGPACAGASTTATNPSTPATAGNPVAAKPGAVAPSSSSNKPSTKKPVKPNLTSSLVHDEADHKDVSENLTSTKDDSKDVTSTKGILKKK